MKKILPFILLSGIGFLAYSCDNKDDVVVQNTVDSQMKDVTGTFNSGNTYAFKQGIKINSTDVVLVYRDAGGAWQQIPKSVYLADVPNMPTNRVFDYNFVFDSQNVQIRIDDANFNLATGMTSTEAGQYLNNQRFRIVLLPANPGNNLKTATPPVDYSDYNAVVKYYNLNDSNVSSTRVN
ncbi:MAG: hypothetical protein MUW56_13255 [Chryseobacterium sp.]|uniref:hypothetical protein n=1 Tax=Chryseobacterium sp. TaxID=1871047 RepID=UPI0025C0B9A1|nr:hypothetical protein [Chryseobacterium sp.]MCJ7934561.1 hypothetical protein [Chryseobacterium sp.]